MSLVYFVLWVIFNGRVTAEIVIAGAVISLGLDLFVKRCLHIRFTGANFLRCVKLLPDAVFYGVVLLVEIVRANAAITRLVLAPRIEVEPCLVKFRTQLKTNAARVALANSITLTPGTITVSLEGDELLVHALNREIAAGLEGSIFERLLARMERIADA
ncbi:MAG: Na+/H+ antiporter subunit E [Synergistaceae bacterium]|nr:Na+/H+ antiporter subunit E [Synergistaceae bacterium]